jgi:hypothetical protein
MRKEAIHMEEITTKNECATIHWNKLIETWKSVLTRWFCFINIVQLFGDQENTFVSIITSWKGMT